MSDEVTLSYDGQNGETIRINATQSAMHSEVCAFKVNQAIYADNSAHFGSVDDSQGSPLIDKLFTIDHVSDVTVTHDTMRVTIEGEAEWELIIPKVGAAIRDALNSDEPAINKAITDTQLAPEEIQRRVQNVLDTMINPAVSAHGGVVNLLDVTNNTVFLEFGGGCQGCGMINVTLKYGVERSIREEVPEVGEILDTTDHASGRNPYYAPSSK